MDLMLDSNREPCDSKPTPLPLSHTSIISDKRTWKYKFCKYYCYENMKESYKNI